MTVIIYIIFTGHISQTSTSKFCKWNVIGMLLYTIDGETYYFYGPFSIAMLKFHRVHVTIKKSCHVSSPGMTGWAARAR